ncbi:alpha-ketoglutarate-dependent dioxygenase AlkB [Hypericibacter sp.]|uniref:alpha-ketoglutarate-dependent dioxygenase AlkB n=1 Tax=Hypericibacter sp. TaxID=2705401 RepID=UPI003D6D776A
MRRSTPACGEGSQVNLSVTITTRWEKSALSRSGTGCAGIFGLLRDARRTGADPTPRSRWRGIVPRLEILTELRPLREKAAYLAGLPADALVQALLTRYDPGAGIGWHRDRPVFEHVLGISLGQPAVMRFRRRRAGGFDRASAALAPRSLYHLTGEVRHEWEHSIAAMDAIRWSITFRSLSEKGRRMAPPEAS